MKHYITLSILALSIMLLSACSGSYTPTYTNNYPVYTPTPAPEPVKIVKPDSVMYKRLGAEKTERAYLLRNSVEGTFFLLQKVIQSRNLGGLADFCYKEDSTKITPCDVDSQSTEWIKEFINNFSTGQIIGETIYLKQEAILRIFIASNHGSTFQKTINLRLIKIEDNWYVKKIE
jgi:hypothetical protein